MTHVKSADADIVVRHPSPGYPMTPFVLAGFYCSRQGNSVHFGYLGAIRAILFFASLRSFATKAERKGGLAT
jgi:hypothetical protein